jgi:hypothetical protein
MDSYVDQFQAAGGSMVMLAKGNRSKQVTAACEQHGGFYLGSIGGPAARLALDNIKQVDVLEYPELGMEAVWKIEVVDFPAFIVVDDKGNDFFEQVKTDAAAATSVSLASPAGRTGGAAGTPVVISAVTVALTGPVRHLVPLVLLGPVLGSALGIDGGAIFQIFATEDLGLSPTAIGIAFGRRRAVGNRSRSGPHECRCGGPGAISRPIW